MMPRGRPRKPGARQPNGQPSRAGQDPRRTVLLARAAHTGHKLKWTCADCQTLNQSPDAPCATCGAGPDETAVPFISKKDVAMLQQPWLGCVAGRAIAQHKDAVELWGVIKLIRLRRTLWLNSIGAPAEAAKGMNIPVAPGMGDGEAASYDPRTVEERAESARRAWDEIEALMFAANPLMQAVVCLDREVKGDVAAWVRQVGRGLR